MRVRIRTLTIALMVLGLLVTSISPASAQDVRTIGAVSVFAGTATVGDPTDPNDAIGYPVCTTGNTLVNPCTSASGRPWSFSANSATFGEAAVGITCGKLTTKDLTGGTVTTETKVFCTLGGGSSGVEVNGASITASGILNSGVSTLGAYCGASGGTGSGTATVSGPNVEATAASTLPAGTTSTSTGPLTFTRNLTINSIGWVQSAATLIVAKGTATAVGPYAPNPTGDIVTVVSAIPDPTTGTSCTNRTQKEFRVVGTAVAVLTS